MTNAELESRTSFLAEQQAGLVEADRRFAAQIASLVEADERQSARIDSLVEADARQSAKIDALVEIQAKSDSRLGRVEDALRTAAGMLTIIDERMDDSEMLRRAADARMVALTTTLQELAEAQKSLTESQKNTDEHLNVFIEVLERYIREGRNGKS